MTSVPYEGATTGAVARGEIIKLLRRFGCESVGFMDDFEKHEVVLAFSHRGRPIQLRASAAGWAQMFLKQNPWNGQRKSRRQEWERKALDQGLIAVNSILRDWIKGQITAVECGILSFEAVFIPMMIAHDGRQIIEHIMDAGLIPRPQNAALPPPKGAP